MNGKLLVMLALLLIAVASSEPLQAAQDTFSVNFYAWGQGGPDYWDQEDWRVTLTLEEEQAAGFDDWKTTGWENYYVPWAPAGPQEPVTITSNQGSTATFTLIHVRNGAPYHWTTKRTTLLDDGNGDLMDGHANATEDENELFDMEVSDIPFGHYDVIIYMGANEGQFGDGTGKIVFNNGPERSITLKRPEFDGTFVEMVDAVTPGNYIVYRMATGPSFTVQAWGNGFNHIAPCGFQFRNVGPSNPIPLDGSQASIGDVDLSWTNMDPNAPGDSVYVDVWFGTDPNELSGQLSLILDAATPEGKDTTGVTVPGLDVGTYYWRVDSYVYGDPTVVTYGDGSDPNFFPVIPGKLWSFEIPSIPILDEEPADAFVYPGETVAIAVVAKNPYTQDDTGLAYLWYRDGVAVPDATGSVLTFVNVQPEDEGLYKCMVTVIEKGTSIETREAEVLTKRMVGHFKFEGNAEDSSPSGNDATLIGTAAEDPLWVEGVDGQCLRISSNGRPYAEVAAKNAGEFSLAKRMTASVWIKSAGSPNPVNPDGYACLVGKHLDTTYRPWLIRQLATAEGPENGLTFRSPDGTWSDYRQEAAGVFDNQWHLVTGTWDGETGEKSLYVDGRLVQRMTGNFGPGITDDQSPLRIGYYKDNYVFVDTLLDDVRIYNYALDEFQVARLYVDFTPGAAICVRELAMDLNNDCRIGLEDFAIFAEEWLLCNRNPATTCP